LNKIVAVMVVIAQIAEINVVETVVEIAVEGRINKEN
jgi:hypothetical protein